MPELPDVELYLEALAPRIVEQPLVAVRLRSPFLVRSVRPRLSEAEGRRVVALRRLGKRILYAENEANYCPGCQTGGKLLADRVLSRLLKDDWPKTLEELEQRKASRR